MFEPTAELIDVIARRLGGGHGTHPSFHSIIEHCLAPAGEHFAAAKADHSPVSDLRLRLDRSSQQMLALNLQLLEGNRPDIANDVAAIHEGNRDHTVGFAAGVLGTTVGDCTYRQSAAELLNVGASEEVLAALVRYVNAFGSWEDAAAIARDVGGHAIAASGDPTHATLIGLSGVVLALTGDASGHHLIARAAALHPNPAQRYFMSLRLASILAKRRGDLDDARSVIVMATDQARESGMALGDVHVVTGMTSNFLALLALRSGDAARARQLVDEATELLPSDRGTTATIPDVEALRYSSMAQLNRAQMRMFAGQFDRAGELLQRTEAFARTHDPRVLHSVLSSTAFCAIRSGRPADALRPAHEALDLLRSEYDPAIVTQVRKLLYKAHVDLDQTSAAERVRLLPDHFWAAEAVPSLELAA